MITLDTRRLRYAVSTFGQAAAARMSGIPQSTLSYVTRGLRDLPSRYVSAARNVYQRAAYTDLRKVGFSSSQAHRYSWYRPEVVQINIDSMNLKVKYLTEGAVGAKIKALKQKVTESLYTSMWQETEEAIREGISNSVKPVEIIYDY